MTTKTTPRLLLIGNGVNLVARSHSNISYDRLLRKAAKDKGVKIEESDSIDSLHEKLANYGYAHSNDNPYAAIYPALSDLRPTYAHHLLCAFSHAFSHILTLNFDYAMERALGCRIATGKENPLQSIPCLREQIEDFPLHHDGIGHADSARGQAWGRHRWQVRSPLPLSFEVQFFQIFFASHQKSGRLPA